MTPTAPRRRGRAALPAIVLAIIACTGFLLAQRPDPAPPGTFEQAGRELDTWRADVDRRLDRIEHALRGTPEEPPVTEPPPDPPPATRPTRPPPAQKLGASWDFTLRDGSKVAGRAVAADGLLEAQAGPLRVVVVWEDLDGVPGPDPEHWTAFVANAQAGVGELFWQSLDLRVGNELAIHEGRGCMPPRDAIPATSLDLAALRLVPETDDLPAELRAGALAQIEAAKVEHVGPYPFLLPCPDGGCDKTAPGGRATAPWHGGRRDWLAGCAEGLAYRLAEALDAASREGWCMDADGAPWMPGSVGARYWWWASAREYALQWQQDNKRPGWGWVPKGDGWCSYEIALAGRPISNQEHSGRFYKAISAVASKLRVGTWLLVNYCWPEVERSMSMDRRVPGTDDPNLRLYNPLWFILERVESGAWTWSMDRAWAHCIELFTEAAPSLPAEKVELYATAFSRLVVATADLRGILDHSRTGDAASAGLPGNVSMWFQNAMMVVALRRLAELPGAEAVGPIADKLTAWWLPGRKTDAPYYASTSGNFASAFDAPHKGTGTHEYVMSVRPALAPPFATAVQATIGHDFGEPTLDYYPDTLRKW